MSGVRLLGCTVFAACSGLVGFVRRLRRLRVPRLPVLLSNVAPMVAVGKGPKVTPLGVVAGAADREGSTSRSGGGGAASVGGIGAVGAFSPTLRGASVMSTVVGAGLVELGAMGGGFVALALMGNGRLLVGAATDVGWR